MIASRFKLKIKRRRKSLYQSWDCPNEALKLQKPSLSIRDKDYVSFRLLSKAKIEFGRGNASRVSSASETIQKEQQKKLHLLDKRWEKTLGISSTPSFSFSFSLSN
ncbi:hypothetical protein D5086_033506 [Populus alba]|uniref:Uncharacterized protein n=1 Tax=Populus alba TaxID=43335 RepID=A0ACC4AH34_POPAL